MSGIVGQRGFNRSGIIGPAASNQPAFLVQSTHTASIVSGTTIPWGTEIFDQGGNFASNTFTAPVTGRYQLNVNMYLSPIANDNTFLQFHLATSNRTYGHNLIDSEIWDTTATYYGMSASTLVDMDASDTAYVWVQFAGSAPTVSSASYFSGYLAC
jgi:hypothetical protein